MLSELPVQRFIGTNWRKKFIDRLIQVAARESLESPLQLKRTKLGFADPYLRNLNFVCRCRMHIETLPFPKTDFQLPAEVAVRNLTEKAAIFDLAILAGRSRRVSVGDVTAHIESRNDRAENAWLLGCIRRWAQEVGGGGRGYGWDFWRLLWKNCHKVSRKNSIFLFMCLGRL